MQSNNLSKLNSFNFGILPTMKLKVAEVVVFVTSVRRREQMKRFMNYTGLPPKQQIIKLDKKKTIKIR